MNNINGLIILTSVTLAFIQFVSNTQNKLIDDIKKHLNSNTYPSQPPLQKVEELKKERDNFVNGDDSQLEKCSTKPFVYTSIAQLILYSLVSAVEIFLPEGNDVLKYIIAIFFAVQIVINIFVILWLIEIDKQKKYAQALKKEHGYFLAGVNCNSK